MRSALGTTVLLALALVAASPGRAGAAIAQDYVRTSFTAAWSPIAPEGGAASLAFADANDGTAPAALPFAFTYNGSVYPAGTIVTVCVNGWATLATPLILSVSMDNFQLYGGQTDLMAPWWDDLSAGVVGANPAGGVLHQVLGTPGSRRWVIQWTGISAWKDLTAGQPRAIHFQLVLEEGTNAIEFRYKPLANGSYSSRESASSGITGVVSVLDYLDAWTGSGRAGNGLLTTNAWPTRNLRFTPGTPTPIPAGNYFVGAGGDWPSFSEAVAELAHRGVSGRVNMRLADARYDSTTNVFPVVLGPIPGSSAANEVILRSLGNPAALVLPRGTLNGGFFMTSDLAVFGHRGAHLIVVGADHVTVRGMDFTAEPGVQVTAGIYVSPTSVLDGAQNNVFQDIRFDIPNGSGGATAVFQRTVGAVGYGGTCSGNRYLDLEIVRARAGISILGSALQPDEDIVIAADAGAMTIGGTTPSALATSGTAATVGIQVNNVRNLRVSGCEVRNLGNLGSGGAVGIRVDNSGLGAGLDAGVLEVSRNRVHDLYGSTGTSAGVVGIGVSLGGAASESRIFNNTVTELTSASATAARNVAGIRLQEFGAGIGHAHRADFNSVRLEPLGPACSSVGLEVVQSGAQVSLRNNVIANFAGPRTGTAANYAVVTSAAGALAAAGSVSDRNVLYVADPTDGFVGRDGAGDRPTLGDWRAAVGEDAHSIAGDPRFLGPLDLHIDPSQPTPVERRGSFFAGAIPWAAADLDGEPRDPAAPDVGADEGDFLASDRLALEPPPGAAIALPTTCVEVPVVWHRLDPAPARGYSVTVELSPELTLCGAQATSGQYLVEGIAPPYFVLTPGDSNRWTVDEVTLGDPCGATGTDTLFTLHVSSVTTTGTGTVRIVDFKLRDCAANAEIFSVADGAVTLPIDRPLDWIALEPAPGARITGAAPCADVAVVWNRTDATPARAYSVTVELDPGLALCPAPATSAGYLAPGLSGTPYFVVTPGDSNRWTVDEATLGAPCGATGSDTLFTLHVAGTAATPPGLHGVRVVEVKARDCDLNAPIPAVPGLPAAVEVDFEGPPAIADLAIAHVTAPPAAGPTRPLSVTFTPPPGAVAIEVWRRPFGGHPQYDEAGGAAPAAPARPESAAAAGWTLTAVTASGNEDDPGPRETWHYVAFSTDADSNLSPPSPVTAGLPNYRLGDVHDGAADCAGDGAVTTADVSFLGAHYGATPPVGDPLECLDIGPTADGTPASRPLTDNQIDFEDLMILSLDLGLAGPPLVATAPRAGEAAPPPAAPRVTLLAPRRVAAGETVEAAVEVAGAAAARGLAVALAWDGDVVEPAGWTAGDLFAGGVTFSPRPGAADGVRLGPAAPPDGEDSAAPRRFATFAFRARRDGDPGLTLVRADARDAANRPLLAAPAPAPGASPPAASPEPSAFALAPPRPNPSRGGTVLEFSLPAAADVSLAVLSVDGRRVRTLAAGAFGPGVHRVAWDGRDADGRAAPPGVYWIRLVGPAGARVRAVALLR